jgi:uroporphyrinogen decarboxylase
MEEYRNSPSVMAECFMNSVEKYGLDGILTDMDTALLAGACGAELDFPKDEPARVKGRAKGSLEEIIENIDINGFLRNERLQIYLEAIKILSKECKNEIFLRGNADQGPFGLAFLLYGMNDFLIDLLDEDKTELIHKLLAKCVEVSIRFHKEVYKAGAHCTSFGDSASGPDLVSPGMYREFAKPYQTQVASELSKEGISTICHICGSTDAILEDMVQTGCAGYELDYKTDVVNVREAFKGKAAFFGNIDPSGVICFGSLDEVRRVTSELINSYKSAGRFVLGAGCAIPKETKSENIVEIVKTVNDLGWY